MQAVRVGFRVTEKGAELAALDILDSFGQRSRLTFGDVATNVPTSAEAFTFTPPKGVEVLRP